jgi:molybdate transport system substrate-binding protein
MPGRKFGLAGAVLMGAAAFLSAGAQAQTPAGPVVFAAASLKTALDEIATAYAAQGTARPRLSYAGSSALARQIEQGAPADIFASADKDWMDYLDKGKHIQSRTRIDLLGNSIVLVAPTGSEVSLSLAPGADLAGALGKGRLALANVDAVPAGRYAKAALEKLGLWESVSKRLAQSENVRAALLFVSRGEAPMGIVYQTDAAAEPAVRIVATFPRGTHPPIIYPFALTSRAKHPDAAAFLAYLSGPAARAVFEKQGFVVLAPAN